MAPGRKLVTGHRGRLRTFAPLAITLVMFATLAVGIVATDGPRFELGLETSVFVLAIAAWATLQAVVGTIIAWQRPENRIGRIMQSSGPLLIGIFLGYLIGAWRYATFGSDDLLGGIAAWWGSISILPAIFVAFPLLGLLFPDGRLPGPRFLWPLRVVVVGLLGPTTFFALGAGPVGRELPDNPFGLIAIPAAVRETANLISTVALIASLVLAIAAVVSRWQRGDALERAQLKWLLAAFSIAPMLFAMSWAGPDVDPADIIDALSAVSVSLVPISIGIAVLRYRLYEIDRIISRTIGWALVTGVLLAVFGLIMVGLQALLTDLTQGATLAVAASTLVAFALFQPLRRRVQRAVDRRFDRTRYDAARTVAAFAEMVRDEVVLERLIDTFVASAGHAVRPERATVWLPPRSVR